MIALTSIAAAALEIKGFFYVRSQLYRVKRPQRIEGNQRPEVHHISNWKKSRPGADFAPHTSSSSLLNLHFFFFSLFEI